MGLDFRSLTPLSGREQKHTLIIQSAGFLCKSQKKRASIDALSEEKRNTVQLCLCLRKKPPARQISTATQATMTEPTMPETVVPTGVSLSAKA